jgi:[protein-PII] uridylyltransferase
MMHNLDFLGLVLPEFERLTCLVQHDLYHRYTVDEHTLRAIEVLDELAESRARATERYRELYRKIADPLVLHLGLVSSTTLARGSGEVTPRRAYGLPRRFARSGETSAGADSGDQLSGASAPADVAHLTAAGSLG